jgi:hypothetical protein
VQEKFEKCSDIPKTLKNKTVSGISLPYSKYVMFFWTYKDKQRFCVYNNVTDGVFVTQLSTNARISVWRIVWVTTNRRLMSDVSILELNLYVCGIKKI